MAEVRRARGLGALMVLLGLLVGLPAALGATIGNPAGAWPDLLAGDLTDQVLVGLLAAVAWVAWAQFAVATVVEAASELRRTPVPRRIPGVLRAQQQLARSLVGAVFLLGPVTAAAVLPATTFGALSALPPTPAVPAVSVAATLAGAPAIPAHRPDPPHRRAPSADRSADRAGARGTGATTVYTVPAGSGPATWWDIAQTHLGAGEAWRQIWLLNEGRSQPDGTTMTSPGRLLPGWTVLLPAAAPAHPGADLRSGVPGPASEATDRGDTPPGAASGDDVDPAGGPATGSPAMTERSATSAASRARQVGDVPAPPATKTSVVQPHDTLWDIAQAHLGDPLRHRQIAALNPETVGPDHEIRPGELLVMPHDATGLPAGDVAPAAAGAMETATVAPTPAVVRVRVVPGDTLWGITQQVSGPGTSWMPAWRANRGRTEPGGARFNDPDLIRSGWAIDIPVTEPDHGGGVGTAADASTSPSPPAARSAAPTTAPDEETPTGTSRAGGPAPAAARPAPPSPSRMSSSLDSPSEDSPSEVSPSPVSPSPVPRSAGMLATRTTSATAPEPAPEAAGVGGTGAVWAGELPMVAFAGGGALLAGLSLGAMVRYRRSQSRCRRPGRGVAVTPPELIPVQRALVAAGRAGTPDVTWLDEALRGLVHLAGKDAGAELPDVVAACLSDQGLELVLAGPHPAGPPAPWTVDVTGTRWCLRRGDPSGYQPARRAYDAPAYPTLVSVGYGPGGEQWLLDLERVGAMSLTGDPTRCVNLARFMAAELAHNTWSELLRVTMVGFGAEMVQINPDRLTHTGDLDAAIAAAHGQLRAVTEAMAATEVDVLSGRLRDVAGDMWFPQVTLIAPHLSPDLHQHHVSGLDRLLGAITAQPGRAAIALILPDLDAPDHDSGEANADPGPDAARPDSARPGDAVPDRSEHPAGGDRPRWELRVDAAGVLRIPMLGLELTACQVPIGEAAALAQMLAVAADLEDHPVAPAHGDQPWDNYADAGGNIRPELTAPPPTEPASAPASAPVPAGTGTAGRTVGPGEVPVPRPGVARTGTVAAAAAAVLPLPAGSYLDHGATTEEDLRALAPVVPPGTRVRVRGADQDLDTDLADWHNQACPRPKVALLGPVTVTARGELPEQRPRLGWNTEVVAYLVTRPRGATAVRYGTDLWADEHGSEGSSRVRQSVTVVRAWLGTDPYTGDAFLPPAYPQGGVGTYRIQGGLVDAELFRRLRLRAAVRGHEGITDLRAALDLVTGVPFDPASRRKDGYGWLSDPPLDHEYTAMIADVAHTVAIHHLGAGEPDLAAAAAQVALRAGCLEDAPLLDLVAACDAQDRRAEAQVWIDRILANHDAEVEEDLPPRTAAILFRRDRQRAG